MISFLTSESPFNTRKQQNLRHNTDIFDTTHKRGDLKITMSVTSEDLPIDVAEVWTSTCEITGTQSCTSEDSAEGLDATASRPLNDAVLHDVGDVHFDNSFESDEGISEDYPETALTDIEDTLSNDETDIEDHEYDNTVKQLRNLVLRLQQHAQQTTEQTVERDQGALVRDTVTPWEDAVQEEQEEAGKFPQNFEDYLVEQRSRHVGSQRNWDLKLESSY